MTTTRKSTEERREEIADAALRIIGTRGIGELTVANLAAELGLTGGALYRHFASTDAILEAVAGRAADLLDATFPPDDLAPRAWLERFAVARIETVGGHVGLARLLLSDQLAFALPKPAIERLMKSVQATRLALARVIAAGQADGTFRDDVPAAGLAPIVMGTLQLIVQHRSGPLLPRMGGDPMQVFETLLRVLAPAPAAKSKSKSKSKGAGR